MDQHAPSFRMSLYSQKKKTSLAHNQLSTAKVHAAFAHAAGERHLLAGFLDPALRKVGRGVHESWMHLASQMHFARRINLWEIKHLLDLNNVERCWCIAMSHHTYNLYMIQRHQQNPNKAICGSSEPRHQYSKLSLTAWWRTGGHSATWKDASLGSSKCKVSGFTQVTWQFLNQNVTILRATRLL